MVNSVTQTPDCISHNSALLDFFLSSDATFAAASAAFAASIYLFSSV